MSETKGRRRACFYFKKKCKQLTPSLVKFEVKEIYPQISECNNGWTGRSTDLNETETVKITVNPEILPEGKKNMAIATIGMKKEVKKEGVFFVRRFFPVNRCHTHDPS